MLDKKDAMNILINMLSYLGKEEIIIHSDNSLDLTNILTDLPFCEEYKTSYTSLYKWEISFYPKEKEPKVRIRRYTEDYHKFNVLDEKIFFVEPNPSMIKYFISFLTPEYREKYLNSLVPDPREFFSENNR